MLNPPKKNDQRKLVRTLNGMGLRKLSNHSTKVLKRGGTFTEKCGHCGRSLSHDDFRNDLIDCYTPFGNCTDLEPPDDVYLCPTCAKEYEEKMVSSGYVGGNWHPSRAERNAAKRLGYVRAGPKGAAWARWFKPDEVPSDYEIYKEG